MGRLPGRSQIIGYVLAHTPDHCQLVVPQSWKQAMMIWGTGFVSELIDEETNKKEKKKKKKTPKIRRRKQRFFDMGLSQENLIGLILALVSSGFIGGSFIIKKQGLRRAAAVSGVRAGMWFLIFSSISDWKRLFFFFPGCEWFWFLVFHFCRCWWVLLSIGATLVGGDDHK